MSEDIYIRRFIHHSRAQGVKDKTDSELTQMALEWMETYKNPKLAAMERFPKKEIRRKNAEDGFFPILREVCHAFGASVDDASKHIETEDWRNIRGISCWIAIHDYDIRPHTPIREILGMANNGMVRHAEYRASRMLNESVLFAEKLIQVREELSLVPLNQVR